MHLNNCKTIALTPVITKCFEKLVLHHSCFKTTLPPTFDSHQFVYKGNRYTENAIAIACHMILKHIEHRGSSEKMLFIHYSSAFSTAVPYILIGRLQDIGLSMSIYICLIKDFLRNCPQKVKIEPHVVVLGL